MEPLSLPSRVPWITDVGASSPMIQIRKLMYAFFSPDHWHDVIAGSFLGLVTAYFAYRQYFRSLASKASHLPYSPRTQRLEVTHDHPAPGLPLYHTLQRPDSDEGEVELIRDALRRDEPGQLERGWEQTHSTESGFSHS